MRFNLLTWIVSAILTVVVSSAGLAQSTNFPNNYFNAATGEVSLRVAQISNPMVVPYGWSARKSDNGTIVLDGYAPNAQVQKQLHSVAGKAAVDATLLARGAPESFEQVANAGIAALSLLQEGQVNLGRDGWSVRGLAPSIEIRELIVARLQSDTSGMDWSIEIAVPEASMVVAVPYVWSAQRRQDGSYAFSGFVPNDSLQRFLRVHARSEVIDSSEIADGEPAKFAETTLAGLEALAKLKEGRISYSGMAWKLVGRAGSADDKIAILSKLAQTLDVGDWLIEITAPAPRPIPPYKWSVIKIDASQLAFSGSVPTPQLQRFLVVRAASEVNDQSMVAAGAPKGFINDSLAVLAAVDILESGEAGYNGKSWYIKGISAQANANASIVDALNDADTAQGNWVVDVKVRPAPLEIEAEAEIPADQTDVSEVEPVESQPDTAQVPIHSGSATYRFVATKMENQSIELGGAVPTDPMRKYLGAVAGKVATSNLVVLGGAPDGFNEASVAGLRALVRLEKGELSYSSRTWSLTGTAQNQRIFDSIIASIAEFNEEKTWKLALDVTPPVELCRKHVEEFARNNTILFDAGSAHLANSSFAIMDQLAEYVEECPDAIVHVEGHTDSDGEENLNLALSVARAEAVVSELVDRGVLADRLYAIGYGESLPIASNDTRKGKAENRRIVFTIIETHE